MPPKEMGKYTPPEGDCSYCGKSAIIECEYCFKLVCMDHYRVIMIGREIFDVCIGCQDEILKSKNL